MTDSPFVNVLAGITQFLDSSNYNALELFTPNRVQLIDLLVLLNCELGEISHKALSSFRVFLGLESIVLNLLLSIFFGLICVRLFLDLWRENCWRRKNLVEMLELLSSLVLIRVGYTLTIDLCYIWETVYNKSSQ